ASHYMCISIDSLIDVCFFSLNVAAPTKIYTLSLHDALPISGSSRPARPDAGREDHARPDPGGALERGRQATHLTGAGRVVDQPRSEEHTSELQSREKLVCRLLLEKKKKINKEYLEK